MTKDAPNSTRSAIVLSWIGFHGRSEGLAKALRIPALYVSSDSDNLVRKYYEQWCETRRLIRERPDLEKVILMLPPLPALLSVAIHSRVRIAGDLHTGVFYDPKWRWALSLTARILRKRGVAIVTNKVLAEEIEDKGVRTLVLHDQLNDDFFDDEFDYESPRLRELGTSDWILVPLAYAYDEPLEEILEAAKLAPEIRWVLTGRAPSEYMLMAPDNVIFTGFIDNSDYRRCVRRCSAIAALTTDENTMQRAGYEALSASQVLITTPMKVLRDYFEGAALYAEPHASSLARAAREAILRGPELRGQMSTLKIVRIDEQTSALAALEAWRDTP